MIARLDRQVVDLEGHSHLKRRTIGTTAPLAVSALQTNGADLLTIEEVAEQLRCSVKSIRRRVHDGRLQPIRAATTRLLFRQADIAALLASGEPGPTSSTCRIDDDRRAADGIGALAHDLAG